MAQVKKSEGVFLEEFDLECGFMFGSALLLTVLGVCLRLSINADLHFLVNLGIIALAYFPASLLICYTLGIFCECIKSHKTAFWIIKIIRLVFAIFWIISFIIFCSALFQETDERPWCADIVEDIIVLLLATKE